MSGTSLDGIDAVLVDLSEPQPALIAQYYQPFTNNLKPALLALHSPLPNELHLAQLAGNELARQYAQSIAVLLARSNISASQVSAIGCHGQTIRHRPEQGYTLQLGNAALLTELTDITVVSDFRSRDIAAGGQGAPLVPAFHDRVLRHPTIHRVIVNIGGISNLTDLAPQHATTGFDCGPGNLLMDAWCEQHTRQPYDANGAWAATGRVIPALLEKLYSEVFFSMPPPKSSGRDLFNQAWLTQHLAGDEKPQDVQACLLELTCRAIADSIAQQCAAAAEIYLCGGGAHNQTLRLRLAELLPNCLIARTDAIGVNGDFLEAVAFAWLAQQALHGKPANLPIVTGARHPCLLGTVYRNH